MLKLLPILALAGCCGSIWSLLKSGDAANSDARAFWRLLFHGSIVLVAGSVFLFLAVWTD